MRKTNAVVSRLDSAMSYAIQFIFVVSGMILLAHQAVHYLSGTDPRTPLTEWIAASVVQNLDEELRSFVSKRDAEYKEYWDYELAKLKKAK